VVEGAKPRFLVIFPDSLWGLMPLGIVEAFTLNMDFFFFWRMERV
jgi:hypothetical protein